MIRVFKTMEGLICQIREVQEGCWVEITAPSEVQLLEVSNVYQIDRNLLRAPLDGAPLRRVDITEDSLFFLVDIPVIRERTSKEKRQKELHYETIPCGIILTKDIVFTVCREHTPILASFAEGKVRDVWTYKRERFVLQVLYRIASMYLQYLRDMNKKSNEVERKLHISTKNRELIELLELEKSIIYFFASLRSNETVLKKLKKLGFAKDTPEEEELFESLMLESEQAMEMADIYREILSGTMDAYASVISNNLNIVMKILAVVTIVMSIPTIIGSYWGMNVKGIPFSNHPQGFFLVVLISILLTLVGGLFFGKKND